MLRNSATQIRNNGPEKDPGQAVFMDEKISAKAEVALQNVKAKTARGKRALEKRLPQVVEGIKTAAFIRGTTTSPTVNAVLSDFFALKKPDAVLCQKRNKVHPFDGSAAEATLEFLIQKNNVSFAVCATHSKKRPHNLTLVRAFDNRFLDMVELRVNKYEPMEKSAKVGCLVGSKPCFLVIGEQFEMNDNFRRVKNLFIDLFRGREVDTLDLLGLESCIVLSARGDNEVLFRAYHIGLKASGSATPSVQLDKMGPSIDFALGRIREPSFELWRSACRYPKETTGGKRVKNISHDALGDQFGRVHVGKQDIESLQTRKVKALKMTKKRN
jgi:ribosome production factor 2